MIATLPARADGMWGQTSATPSASYVTGRIAPTQLGNLNDGSPKPLSAPGSASPCRSRPSSGDPRLPGAATLRLRHDPHRLPEPSADEIDRLLTVAARAPDHGKLNALAFRSPTRRRKRPPSSPGWNGSRPRDPTRAKSAAKSSARSETPPVTIAVISRLTEGDIPDWEQVLSAGAVCTLMVVAAQAMGYGANWITDWYAYDAGRC